MNGASLGSCFLLPIRREAFSESLLDLRSVLWYPQQSLLASSRFHHQSETETGSWMRQEAICEVNRSHLQSVCNFFHLLIRQIQKRLNQVAIDEAFTGFNFPLGSKTPPKAVLNLTNRFDHPSHSRLNLQQEVIELVRKLSHDAYKKEMVLQN